MRLTPSPLFVSMQARPRLRALTACAALVASLGLVAPACASDAHAEAAPGPAKERQDVKPSLKPDLKTKVEGKVEGRAEAKVDAKSDAKPEPRGGDTRASVSMAELRELIDQKIAEVRTKREAAPVVKLQSRAPRSPRTAAPGPVPNGMMRAVYAPDGAADPGTADTLPAGAAVAHAAPAASPTRRAAPLGARGALLPLAAPTLAHGGAGHEAHWAYGGETGPEAWGRLKPEFQQCAVGKRQSPIDIRDGIAVQLDPIQFDYRPSAFRVIDNGHTVQVNVDPGNSITVQGRRYELLQFHFHRPSEERINGRQFEMVAHLVHKDAEGRLAVVAVLMDQGKGHPLVQQVWNNLPLEKNTEQPALVPMDLKALLPEQQQYYTYMGSLTTPPCSEGVLWMVMKQPATMSREQIAIFSKLYPMNARPIQSASGRLIKEGQ